MKCSWVETSFDSLIPALQARKFDAINSAMNVTEQRRQAIAFTDAIYQVPNRLIAKADSGLLPDAKSLAGKHVGVLQDRFRRFTPKPIGRRRAWTWCLTVIRIRFIWIWRPVGSTPRW